MLTKAAASALVLTATLLLAGCGTAPWNEPQFTKGHSASPTTTPRAAATASAVPHAGAPNDLAEGSLHRTLQAGDVRLTVTYWSTLPTTSWRADVDKPISLSLSGASTTDPALPLYLSQAALHVTVDRRGGTTRQLAEQVDRATTSPGDAIRSPASYGQSFIIPAVDADATGLTLIFTYDVLEQTAPTSTTFSRQTGIDTLSIPIAPAG